MAKKSLQILDDKSLARFKKGALERAKEFDVNNIMPLYEELYEEIAHRQIV